MPQTDSSLEVAENHSETSSSREFTQVAEEHVPLGVRVAAAWSWRLIAIALALAAFVWMIVQVRIVVIPFIIALLLSALLNPVVHFFERRHWPRGLGVAMALLLLIAAVSSLMWLIISQLRADFGDFARKSAESWDQFVTWVETGPLGIDADQLDAFVNQVISTIENHQEEIWSGALSATTTVGHLVAGTLLTLFSLIFLLADGKRIWYWVLGFFPRSAQTAIDHSGRQGWNSVGQFTRVQVLVAFMDAVGIGLGAVLLGVPLAVPIAILVFFGSFIPFLGAITTGAFAVFIALIYNGPINALLMLGVVILVNQLEGHVFQPLVIGNAVRVHPLGVVLAVSAGALLAGVPGALFAVPIVAATSAMVNAFAGKQWDEHADTVANFHKKRATQAVAKSRAKHAKKLRQQAQK